MTTDDRLRAEEAVANFIQKQAAPEDLGRWEDLLDSEKLLILLGMSFMMFQDEARLGNFDPGLLKKMNVLDKLINLQVEIERGNKIT